jgi:hypothetical protein
MLLLGRHGFTPPFPAMLARQVVLLNPLESALPDYLPFYKQTAPITRLECALTSHPQMIENTATLSLAESALTASVVVTPLESALTKNRGVGATSFKPIFFCFLHVPLVILPSSTVQHPSSGFVLPPYRYVASPYLLCVPLLRKVRGYGGILPASELFFRHSFTLSVAEGPLITRHCPQIGFPSPHPLKSPRRTIRCTCTLRNEATP